MLIKLAALLLFGVSGILAGLAPTPSKYHGRTVVYARYKPTVKSVRTWYDYPYHYYAYYEHQAKYIYVSESCSSPPSSIEVDITSLFSSMASDLTDIESSLRKHEASIRVDMHNEHAMLYSEVSWVSAVNKIAKSVKQAVSSQYRAAEIQVYDFHLEKQQIYEAYQNLVQELELISAEVKDIQEQEVAIYNKYKKVAYAKWSVYKYISAIVYEKQVVAGEVNDIQEVISYLNNEIEKISSKVGQLVKRQDWLNSWEYKLYVDLEHFQSNIKQFKLIEKSLHVKEAALANEQARLLAQAKYVKIAIQQLKVEYMNVEGYLSYLSQYEKQIQKLNYYISGEAGVFISAYEQFTCQDSLLYYEASSVSSPVSPPAPPRAPAPPQPPRAPAPPVSVPAPPQPPRAPAPPVSVPAPAPPKSPRAPAPPSHAPPAPSHGPSSHHSPASPSHHGPGPASHGPGPHSHGPA